MDPISNLPTVELVDSSMRDFSQVLQMLQLLGADTRNETIVGDASSGELKDEECKVDTVYKEQIYLYCFIDAVVDIKHPEYIIMFPQTHRPYGLKAGAMPGKKWGIATDRLFFV